MKNKTFIYSTTIFAFFLITVFGCKKEAVDPVNQTNGKTTAVFNPDLTYDSIIDQEGNIYKTIKIGNQTWMVENLRTTHYRNGDPIENVKNDEIWTTTTTGAYCNYENTLDEKIIATKGRLYNWYAVSDFRNIAPCGWHIPTDEEWSVLVTYLGSESIAGGKLKEKGILHWMTDNIGASNESGFTALPGGNRDQYYGIFDGQDHNGFWWSSTEDSNTHSWYRFLNNQLSSVGRFSWDVGNKSSGFSVRCIKD